MYGNANVIIVPAARADCDAGSPGIPPGTRHTLVKTSGRGGEHPDDGAIYPSDDNDVSAFNNFLPQVGKAVFHSQDLEGSTRLRNFGW